MNGQRPRRVRLLAVATTLLAGGCVAASTATSDAAWGEVAVVLVLPFAFAVAGLMGLRRQPGALSAAAMTAVGLCHLLSFLLVATAVAAGRQGATALEVSAAAAGTVAYLTGFVALVALAFTLPARPALRRGPQRVLLALVAVAVAPAVVGALAGEQQRLVLVLQGWPEHVAGAGWWPAAGGATALAAPLLAAPLVAALVVVWRFVRATGAQRRHLRWPAAAFAVVVAAIVVQQLVGRDLPESVGDLIFVVALAAIPFTVLPSVLAGAVDDERLAAMVRTSVVLAAAWTAVAVTYAAVVAGTSLSDPARRPVATALVVGCALAPLLPGVRRAMAAGADRLVTGPSVDGYALLREYGVALATPESLPGLCAHTAEALRGALGAPWAEMTLSSGERGRSGTGADEGREPALLVAITDQGGTALGELRCGRRRRGPYGQRDVEAVQVLARQTALAVRNRRLADEVSRHVSALAASRQRLALAGEADRRRIERDLHDGTQQDLVAILSRVELARTVLGFSVEEAASVIDELRADATRAIASLRRTVQGIHPPVLSDRGLVAAVQTRASQLPIDVTVQAAETLRDRRFPVPVEATAYYVVVESLTNVLKHSGARAADVVLDVDGDALVVQVVDAGRGGASTDGGSGLAGLGDRLAAVDGQLDVTSPPGGGTRVRARLPLPAASRTRA